MKLGEDPTLIPRKRNWEVRQSSKKKALSHEELVQKMSSLNYYKGTNILAVTTSAAPAVFCMNEKNVDSWGLVYNPKKGVTVRCEKNACGVTLWKYRIKACAHDTTAKTPECFLLLKDKTENSFICAGPTGEWTIKFDQEKCNHSGWREDLGYKEGFGSSMYKKHVLMNMRV